MKALKTPLRYPGGKSKAIKTLSAWYPKVITEYREPFIGGGSIAIDVTKSNPDIPVWINDLYVPLYNFWVQLRDRGEDLGQSVREQKEKMLESGTQERKTSLQGLCLTNMLLRLTLMTTSRKQLLSSS